MSDRPAGQSEGEREAWWESAVDEAGRKVCEQVHRRFGWQTPREPPCELCRGFALAAIQTFQFQSDLRAKDTPLAAAVSPVSVEGPVQGGPRREPRFDPPVSVEGEDEEPNHDNFKERLDQAIGRNREALDLLAHSDEPAMRAARTALSRANDNHHSDPALAVVAAYLAAASPSSPTGPTDDEIERAAKAIIERENRAEGERWDDFLPDALEIQEAREDARVALTAARGSDSDDGGKQ